MAIIVQAVVTTPKSARPERIMAELLGQSPLPQHYTVREVGTGVLFTVPIERLMLFWEARKPEEKK
jgi:hypothetical protein